MVVRRSSIGSDRFGVVGSEMSMDFGAPADDPKAFRNICRDRTCTRATLNRLFDGRLPQSQSALRPAGILKDLLKPDKDKETKSSWKVILIHLHGCLIYLCILCSSHAYCQPVQNVPF